MTDRIYGVNTAHTPLIYEGSRGSSMDPLPLIITIDCDCDFKTIKLIEDWDEWPGYVAYKECHKVPVNQLKSIATFIILKHLNYDPDYDLGQSILDFHSTVKSFERTLHGDSYEFSEARKKLERATNEITQARERNLIWGNKDIQMKASEILVDHHA